MAWWVGLVWETSIVAHVGHVDQGDIYAYCIVGPIRVLKVHFSHEIELFNIVLA